MGIIVSIPQIDGFTTDLSLSSANPSSSYAFDPTKSSAFAVSTAMFNQSNTQTPISAAPVVQTSLAPPADVTGDMLIDDPTILGFSKTVTTYIHTATVTSKINSTSLITATTTVAASYCPTTTVRNKIKSVPSIRFHTTSTLKTPTHSSPPAIFSHLSIPLFSRLSENPGHITHTSVLAHSRLPATIISHHGTISHNRLAGSGAESTSLTRMTSKSHIDRGNIAIRGPPDTSSESKHKPSTIGLSVEITKLDRVTRTRTRSTLSVLSPNPWDFTTTMTRTKDVTTTTVYTDAITNHTTTTTITAFPIICATSKASTSISTSSTSCTSATPNPSPPANDTCAEDGLLEYSNTPQPPDTLEGCAVACLGDASCLSFTFVPSESKCYTSLYPLADSAFAGRQQYHIYNYDRDCYSCSA